MTDKYRIDSHKLMYHIERVYKWLNGDLIYPIYIEVSPSGACNQRCIFCGLDFMKYQPRFLNKEILEKRLFEMANLGVKSIMYSGEGEPLLHKEIDDIIFNTKKFGIDVAVTTNGVFLNRILNDKILECITWIKISMNAGTKETYVRIHRSNPNDFDCVIKNIYNAVKMKKDENCKCTFGVQFLLLPENLNEVEMLARMMKDIGVDYFLVKSYSQHLLSENVRYKNIKYEEYLSSLNELKYLNDKNFSVIIRANTMKKWDYPLRNYERCLALPFWSYIDAGGNVWGCSCYLNDSRFHYGNINNQTFEEIWTSKKRKKSLQFVEESLDTSLCRINCRMDKINEYLWELKNSSNHINFI